MLPVMKRNRFLPDIFDELEDFFSTPFFFNERKMSVPKINVIEEKEAFKVEVAAPGFDKTDFNVEVKDDVLTISTKKEEEKNEEGKNYKRREFCYSAFSRSFILPDMVDKDNLNAEYKNGILIVNIPKLEEAKEKPARTIEIK